MTISTVLHASLMPLFLNTVIQFLRLPNQVGRVWEPKPRTFQCDNIPFSDTAYSRGSSSCRDGFTETKYGRTPSVCDQISQMCPVTTKYKELLQEEIRSQRWMQLLVSHFPERDTGSNMYNVGSQHTLYLPLRKYQVGKYTETSETNIYRERETMCYQMSGSGGLPITTKWMEAGEKNQYSFFL